MDRTEGQWKLYKFTPTSSTSLGGINDATLNCGAYNGLHLYEAAVVVGWSARTVAPPCRLFPREDGLGVGGGRIYPPPRSQQRSGRRFGYY